DPAETRAIKELLQERAVRIPINSTKSMTGHLIAAAAAVEAVVCVQSIRHGKVHPTRGLLRPDPLCDLDYVAGKARDVRIRHALSNSLGFAGINSTLVFSRLDP
ncbi:MAG TPA: beta-ketoacyl-[acyl-carrier-protein] synthase II, partial [Candidatus Ozemobacteraceae bacterium]|nr:beta-ketoacyl-[acyl-carrier-protein] synthase II [Candidatus Ozemobacteraceae bacterium]